MDKIFTLPVGSAPTEDNIRAAVEFNEKLSVNYSRLDDYYLGFQDILDRKKGFTLSNNKLVTNHCKYITDINVGYLLGNPVDYQVEEPYTDEAIEPVLREFKRQTIADIDVEVAKMTSKLGRAYEYVYINSGGDVKSALVDPRNAIIVYDNSFERNPMWTVMYEKNGKNFTRLTVVTDWEIIDYEERKGKLVEILLQTHLFGGIPLIEYSNNRELQGDYEQVMYLIDAYNFLQSDRVNDKEQLVEAILVMYGFMLTEEQRKDLKTFRTLSIGENKSEAQVEYITKSLDEAQIELLRNSLEEDIHKISMTPNMSDENFVGNSSGVAIAYKLLPFEQNTKNKERGMETGLKSRFGLYNNYLTTISKMEFIDLTDLDVVFKRNLPKNDLETSQMIVNLSGKISDETLVSQISFVKDASVEIKKAQEESLVGMNMEVPEFGTPENTLESLEEKGLVEATATQDSLLEKLKNLLK